MKLLFQQIVDIPKGHFTYLEECPDISAKHLLNGL